MKQYDSNYDQLTDAGKQSTQTHSLFDLKGLLPPQDHLPQHDIDYSQLANITHLSIADEHSAKFRNLIQQQDHFFQSGATKSYAYRVEQLRNLYGAIKHNESAILAALYQDLRKHETEGFMTEVGILYAEISEAIRHLHRWMKPLKVSTPLVLFPATSRIIPEPLGRALLISPWNYPVQLCLAPLIGAIAAGNVAVIKPSELSPRTSAIIEQIINSTFPAEYVHVVTGGVDVSSALLSLKWDYIFFTGSQEVGKIVARAASKHLTPCTLELGGKSPCVVTASANLEIAARRIIFGKLINSGQTCVAPDYLLVEASVHDRLVAALIKEIKSRYGEEPIKYNGLPKIINQKHFERLARLIEPGKIAFGGHMNAAEQLIEPTVLTGVTITDPIMQEETFGPILPIIAFNTLREARVIIQSFDKPLALYLFSENRREQQDILASISFGGGCINDTVVHLSNPNLPFGGVGSSGMGSYHGHCSFKAFSHFKGIVANKTFIDLPVRYPPWKKLNERILRLIFR